MKMGNGEWGMGQEMGQRGQSIVEYLVVTTAIIAIIVLTVAPMVALKAGATMSNAVSKIIP